MLVFDEVQTGIGRTGTFLVKEQFEVEADIITLAKGLGGGFPIGAVLCGEKTKDVISYGEHGSTFGGNPLACAAANSVLERFLDLKLVVDIKNKGDFLIRELKSFKSENIVQVRGKGLMIGIELKSPVDKYIEKARENGLLILSAGNNTIRLLPPLNISEEEILEGIKILKKIL